jgi:site-specific DNA-methyltransferase (adenine-specific)
MNTYKKYCPCVYVAECDEHYEDMMKMFEVNTIYNEDCFEFMKRQSDNSFDVSFTSPPYNRVRNDTYAEFDDVNDNYLEMLDKLTDELLRITKKDVIINVQQNMYNKAGFFRWLGDKSAYIKGVVVWIKNNPLPNSNYRESDKTYSVTNAFEYFVVFSKDPKEFRANNSIYNYIRSNVNSEHFEGHGAVMKKQIAEHFISNFTKEGDIVFDPFMGIGTTAVVCRDYNRGYVGCEIVAKYCDMADRRIKDSGLQMKLF